jgi:hypothetical protein
MLTTGIQSKVLLTFGLEFLCQIIAVVAYVCQLIASYNICLAIAYVCILYRITVIKIYEDFMVSFVLPIIFVLIKNFRYDKFWNLYGILIKVTEAKTVLWNLQLNEVRYIW